MSAGITEQIADELSGWPIGNGYYQATISVDEAQEIAAMLAPLIGAREMAAMKHALLSAAHVLENDPTVLLEAVKPGPVYADWLRARAEEEA